MDNFVLIQENKNNHVTFENLETTPPAPLPRKNPIRPQTPIPRIILPPTPPPREEIFDDINLSIEVENNSPQDSLSEYNIQEIDKKKKFRFKRCFDRIKNNCISKKNS